jgi:hypothetical protein
MADKASMKRAKTIVRAIDHALICQGLILWAQLEPEAAPGLLKAADHHRGRAAAMIDELQGRVPVLGGTVERAPLDHRLGLEGNKGGGQGK